MDNQLFVAFFVFNYQPLVHEFLVQVQKFGSKQKFNFAASSRCIKWNRKNSVKIVSPLI